MDAGFFKGTSADQDNRFVDKNKKLMKTMKFAEGIEKKIDMTRVDMEIMRPWINSTITSYLGYEDDVVVEFACSQLEQSVDSKQMQVNLTGFLGAKPAREFMQKLWDLLVSAMDDICGIPAELKEQKKEQIRLKQVEQERLNEMLKTQQSIIQEAIAKIKVNAATKNERNSLSFRPEKSEWKGRSGPGNSRSKSRSPSPTLKFNAGGNKESLDVALSTEVPATIIDHLNKNDLTPSAEKKEATKVKLDEASSRGVSNRRPRPSSYGRNRMRSPSPQKSKKRELSPYRKSSKKRSQSPGPGRQNTALVHRRSVSPQNERESPDHGGGKSSWKRRSQNHNYHQSVKSSQKIASPRYDSLNHNAGNDARNRRLRGQDEYLKEVQQHAQERSRSRALSDENTGGVKSYEKLSIFHNRNYRSHVDQQSSPENGSNADEAYSRGNRNGHGKSASPRKIASRKDFSPQRKASPRQSSSDDHRYTASPRRDHGRQNESYPDTGPVYSHRRQLPVASRSHVERSSLLFNPGRTLHNRRWTDDRHHTIPLSRYDDNEMTQNAETSFEPTSFVDRRAFSGHHDRWSEWDEVTPRSRQRSPTSRYLPGYERCADERQRLSPCPSRYISDERRARGELFIRDRRGPDSFDQRTFAHRQRHSRSPYGRNAQCDYSVRATTPEYHIQQSSSRRTEQMETPPPMARHSSKAGRTVDERHRSSYGLSVTGEKYEAKDVHYDREYGKQYRHCRDKYNTLVQLDKERDSCRERWGHEVAPQDVNEYNLHEEKWAIRHVQPGDRAGYDSRRNNRFIADSHFINKEPRKLTSERSQSQQSSASPERSRSPQRIKREGWREEIENSSQRTLERHDRDSVSAVHRMNRFDGMDRAVKEEFEYGRNYREKRWPDNQKSRDSIQRSVSPASSHHGDSPSLERVRSASRSSQWKEVSYKRSCKELEDRDDGKEQGSPRSPSPISPRSKKMKIDDGIRFGEASEEQEEEQGSKKKKKKKDKKKKRKKHKKHKKHKRKKSEEDDDSDRQSPNGEVLSQPLVSSFDERLVELRGKGILSLKSTK